MTFKIHNRGYGNAPYHLGSNVRKVPKNRIGIPEIPPVEPPPVTPPDPNPDPFPPPKPDTKCCEELKEKVTEVVSTVNTQTQAIKKIATDVDQEIIKVDGKIDVEVQKLKDMIDNLPEPPPPSTGCTCDLTGLASKQELKDQVTKLEQWWEASATKIRDLQARTPAQIWRGTYSNNQSYPFGSLMIKHIEVELDMLDYPDGQPLEGHGVPFAVKAVNLRNNQWDKDFRIAFWSTNGLIRENFSHKVIIKLYE